MGEEDILQALIARAGQARPDRVLTGLDPATATLDCRDGEELLRVTRELAARLPYRSSRSSAPATTWSAFFSLDRVSLQAAMAAGSTPPHLALLLAFAEVYAHPRAALNAITGRHLDHYYRQVLRMAPCPAKPERAHLVLDPKKGAERTEVNGQHRFSAGKGASKLLFAPVRTTVVGSAKVASMRGEHLEAAVHGRLRCAAIVDSADGLGGALPVAAPAWSPLGNPAWPLAEVGFAVGSASLRLAAGERRIRVEMSLDAPLPAIPAGAFVVFLTGAKGWLGPFAAASSSAGTELRVAIDVPSGAPSITDFDPAVHGYRGTPGVPLMQCLFRGQPGVVGHADVATAGVRSVSVQVEASGVPPTALANDQGAGDPKKPFQAFGVEPAAGARFTIHCPDVLAHTLTELSVALQWRDVPERLAAHYVRYTHADGSAQVAGNQSFTADVLFQDAGGWTHAEVQPLFDARDAQATHSLVFRRGAAAAAAPNGLGDRRVHMGPELARAMPSPAHGFSAVRDRQLLVRRTPASEAVPGAISLRLNQGFKHREYRDRYVAAVLAASKPDGTLSLPAEPYTPLLGSIRLAFKASSGPASIDSDLDASLGGAEAAFYHVGCFGLRREHRLLRAASAARPSPRVPLLPELPVPGGGVLHVGLTGAAPGDSVSLLFQVLEGSSDQDLARATIRWSVLCDDHWRPCEKGEIAADTTNGLLRSGIVQVQLPTSMRLDHHMMPAGLAWLRATTDSPADAVCRIVRVDCNAVEVASVADDAPATLARPLPAGSIGKLETPIAAIKSVAQPFASFGGSATEDEAAFRVRVSERLRHKGRAITIWDHERIVLEAFPAIHRVKCIPHSDAGGWLQPGHVMLVTIADLRGRNGMDRLQPRVDADTLSAVRDHVQRRTGMQVRVIVKNPTYERIRVECAVRFKNGEDFNHRRNQLNEALVQGLSPWAFDTAREPRFGEAVHRSRLLQLVEELTYVDFVTRFRMVVTTPEGTSGDVHFAHPSRPDAVLVSEREHTIAPVT